MSDIWLADLVRALDALRPSPAERIEIMRMLTASPARPPEAGPAGRGEPGAPVPGVGSSIITLRDGGTRAGAGHETGMPEVRPAFDPGPPRPEREEPDQRGLRGSRFLRLRRRVSAIPRGRSRAAGAGASSLTPAGRQMPDEAPDERPSLPRPDEAMLGVRPAFVSLLAARSTRSVLYHLLARRIADGPLDTTAAVTMLVEQRPPVRIPRLHRLTLRYGAQVLVDRSDSMRPFTRDQQDLVRTVRQLIGPATTDVRYFTGSPMRGVAKRPAGSPTRYVAPSPGTPLLLLGDFGTAAHLNCAPGAPRTEWEAFFRLCAQTGDQPIALLPYRVEQAPGWLRRRCRLVTWDRTTTANSVGTRFR